MDELASAVVAGDRRALARAITMVENGSDKLPGLSAALFPHTGRAHSVGLTGAPGAGKSSLTAALIQEIRSHDLGVGVLAIDPTSPFTGGALLGDRLRMQMHATDPGVFIRSMATRGHLGGLALAAPEAIRVLDAGGRDIIVVETVGVGQVEVEIATTADTTIVVVTPGWGDSIQVAKAGIMEIADVFVVNKADKEGADRAVRDLQTMIEMGPERDWTPPVVPTSTLQPSGIAELWEAVSAHRAHLGSSGELERRRNARLLAEVEHIVAQRLRERAASHLEGSSSLVQDLVARRVDPYAAAEAMLRELPG